MYPRTSYIIYATPRSGSYLLCEALTNTGLAGKPTEHFTPPLIIASSDLWGLSPLDSAVYLQGVYADGTTPNGVFGTKIIWQGFEDALDLLRDIEGNEKLTLSELISTVFPHHRAIMVTRRDKLRQAISFWKAIQTGQWRSFENKIAVGQSSHRETRGQAPIFNFRAIEACRQHILDDEREMQEYFASHHIQPFTVVYEDFVSAYEGTALQILDFLHIPVPNNLVLGERKMRKQSNEQTEEWLQQYYQMKQTEENCSVSSVS